MNFDSDGIEEFNSLMDTLERNEYRSRTKKLELEMKHRESPPARPSIIEAPKLELKALLPHLRYVFYSRDDTLRVIIASKLNIQ